jgi:cytochrome bd-type quinol oxidase subunit 2
MQVSEVFSSGNIPAIFLFLFVIVNIIVIVYAFFRGQRNLTGFFITFALSIFVVNMVLDNIFPHIIDQYELPTADATVVQRSNFSTNYSKASVTTPVVAVHTNNTFKTEDLSIGGLLS